MRFPIFMDFIVFIFVPFLSRLFPVFVAVAIASLSMKNTRFFIGSLRVPCVFILIANKNGGSKPPPYENIKNCAYILRLALSMDDTAEAVLIIYSCRIRSRRDYAIGCARN